MHQIIAQVNALSFNQSDDGCGHFGSFSRRTHSRCWATQQGRGCGPQCTWQVNTTQQEDFYWGYPKEAPLDTLHQGPPDGLPQGGPPLYPPLASMHVCNISSPTPASVKIQQAPPYSNIVKCFAIWNVWYLCGFDVANGHTSMSCPVHLQKALHDIYFMRRNAQQYID